MEFGEYGIGMRCLCFLGLLAAGAGLVNAGATSQPAIVEQGGKTVCILELRDDVGTPMVYLVRRGVKAAMQAGADALILDMETNGGTFVATKEIMDLLDRFPGLTVTYVNKDAYSAGAFIAVATQKIYMAPQGVIGAAAPILMSPGGGVAEMPNTLETKMVSAVAARIRASAEKNGHNKQVVDSMINKTKKLVIDGEVLNEEGNILTLTASEAARTFGDPPKPLLSAGTVDSMDDLIAELGLSGAERIEIRPTGAERLASWINAIQIVLLIIGIVGLYIEFKTPGFGVPGIVGILALGLYFFGGYVAGLSGAEWVAVFVVGLVLIGLELFLFPGVMVLGLTGAGLILVALIMAMVDLYPGGPTLPSFGQVQLPLGQILIAFLLAAAVILGLGRILPTTPLYARMVSQEASGIQSVATKAEQQRRMVGQEGVTVSLFGDVLLDVMSEGEMIEQGRRVRVIRHSATEAVVVQIEEDPQARI